jgi:hypothetical protein
MCHPSYRQTAEAEVNRRVQAREMFTAWDITCAVRAQGVRESHRILKEVVHSMHRYGQMGDYERTFMAVGAGPTQAFLFHHPDNDPCDYGRDCEENKDGDEYDLSQLVPVAKRSLLDSLLNRFVTRVTTVRRT